ncbi:hypothetical protein EEL30_21365 [Brevibacillus laterosporus]|uniref:Uncharacterized protein n=1 Tax=Brevibacillus laterosporus TaxID=1465 RepID=A0A518VC84_BRELA|nr:hypothetical protein EEL30_21365 [Brevibacillus laterosporus]
MRKFKIVYDYEFGEDGCVTTLYDENNSIILSGDWYHHKITHQVEGFFHCLDYLEIQYENISEDINN